MTSSTSATSSGSSALVTSSSSSSSRLHRERADDRDALLLSAGEPVGILVPLVREPEAAEELVRARLRLRLREPERLPRPERDVVEHGHVREEVEGLEDDPDPAPDAFDVDAGAVISVAAHDDPARVDRLEQVHAAQERRLAGARGADEADDLVLVEREIDPAQHLELAERLVEALDERARRVTSATPAACRRRRSRATSQSVKRASGIVISDEERRGDEVGRAVERRRLVDLRLAKHLDDPEHADERGVLLEPDEVVEQRRDHPPDRLRDHDVAERLEVGQAERARGRVLARMHGLDARAIHLGHVRGVDEDERDDRPEDLRRRDPVELRAPASPTPSMRMTRIVGTPRKKSV